MLEGDPLEGVTDQTVTVQVTAGQYEQLAHTQVYPGRPRVTHKLSVGPFAMPGVYVVTSTTQRMEPPESTYWVTLSLVRQ